MERLDLRRGISIGVYGGMLWGVLSLIISYNTNLFGFDFTILHNIPVFIAGGAGFGLIVGAFLEVLGDRLPFEGRLPKAIVVSVAIWLTFFTPGLILHQVMPDRYTVDVPLHIQGLFLATLLGLIVGGLWRRD